MAMVGDKNSINWMMPAPASSNSVSSSQKSKPTTGSSNSSSDFTTFFSPKKSSEKDSDRGEAATQANFPGQPKSDFTDKLPPKLNNGPVSETRAQIERPGQPAANVQARMEKRELDESVDNLTHRQAIQNLLKRMKEEFGLDAEAVVEAFSALTPQELMSPPEASLDKLIQALPLTPEQQAQAKLYFQQMLKDTASNDMADYLKTSQRQLSLEVVSQKEARDRAIQRAVDKMQSDFFTQPQAVPQQQPGIAADKYKQVQSSGPEKNAAPVTPFMANAMPNRGGLEASAQMAPMMMNQVPQEGSGSQNDGSAGQFQELSGTVGQSSNKMTAAATLAAGAATVALPEEQTSIPAEMTESNELGEAAPDLFDMQMDPNFATLDIPDAEIVSVNTTGSSAGSSAPAAATVVNPMASAGESSMGGRDDNGGSEEQSADSFNQPVNNIGADKQQTVNGLKNESFIVNTQPTPIQEAQNIKEVISRAQMLATKGGGEMKIVMNPEALGEVTMKVAVQNGQVNVEMIAESREAKKLLETGLGDLKATLLSNNLKVDQIKVETPADIGRQLTQNHDEAQRQFAQQFMEQFRQENNEWRRGFYDIGGAKPYRGQKEEAERGPNVNNSSDRRRESRRLDLVA